MFPVSPLFNSSFVRFMVKINIWYCFNQTEFETFNFPKVPKAVDIETSESDDMTYFANFVKNVGSGVNRVFCAAQSYLRDEPSPDANSISKEDIMCDFRKEYSLDFSLHVFWIFVLFTFLLIFVPCLISCVVLSLKRRHKYGTVSYIDHYKEEDTSRKNTVNNQQEKEILIKSETYNYTPLLVTPHLDSNESKTFVVQESEVGLFLQSSVGFLYRELDNVLLERRSTSPEPNNHVVTNSSQSAITSPRLTSRRLINRHRRSTSPMIPVSQRTNEDVSDRKAWQEFQNRLQQERNYPYYYDVDRHLFMCGNDKVKHLTQFYKGNCTVNYEGWKGCCLIVNYLLYLLEKTLKPLSKDCELSFVEFKMTGSISKGFKVSEVDCFDAHMVFQGDSLNVTGVSSETNCQEVPPGKLVLRTSQTNSNGHVKKQNLAKDFRFESHPKSFKCLLSHALTILAENLIDRALQKLYTETRSLVDRLPFKIQKLTTADLTLSLDTRNTIGIYVPEIRIHLIPAFPLAVSGWYQSSSLYAVPPWHVHDSKRKLSNRGNSPSNGVSDMLWSVSLGEFEIEFFEGVNRKMKIAGVHSCHRVLLGILKVMFSPSNRRFLLDRGEISPIILEYVICFLLLESSPKQWSFDQLANRFSDSVIFLKTALMRRRLPNFFINNPHLQKQMPAINWFPFMLKGRQENMFGYIREDECDKMLSYIDTRMKECKMNNCLSSEYSEDMWEYEFFVFS